MSWLSGSWIATAWNNAWGDTPSTPPTQASGLSHFRSAHFSKLRHFYTAHFAGVAVTIVIGVPNIFKSYIILTRVNDDIVVKSKEESLYVR